MKTINTESSSFISDIKYSGKSRTLLVKLKSEKIYKYKNVPRDIAVSFAEAESKGKFFNQNISGIYDSELMS